MWCRSYSVTASRRLSIRAVSQVSARLLFSKKIVVDSGIRTRAIRSRRKLATNCTTDHCSVVQLVASLPRDHMALVRILENTTTIICLALGFFKLLQTRRTKPVTREVF